MKEKLTQQNMADSLNLSLNAYQKYEQGDRMPSYSTMVKIAEIFNVHTDFLLDRDDFLRSTGVDVDGFLSNLPNDPK